MMDQAFFREQIQLVRSEFFPGWDRGKKWRISLSSNPEHLGDGNDGLCEPEKRKIWISANLAQAG